MPLRFRGAISAVVVLGWLAHASALNGEIDAHGALRIGFAVMLSVTLWVSVAAYWLENRNFALDGLRFLVLPCAAVAAVLPALFPGAIMQLEQLSPLFSWHIAIAMMAYSTLTIAAFHAVLMALQETRLHAHPGAPAGWFVAAIDRLPALLTMEKLLF
ncbi:MAG TPA: inner membrane protein YpjD, partial [Burkholderiaceae bacterium]|nr:inner membrane protein YpjD [Burkholderiaceae bacterium]